MITASRSAYHEEQRQKNYVQIVLKRRSKCTFAPTAAALTLTISAGCSKAFKQMACPVVSWSGQSPGSCSTLINVLHQRCPTTVPDHFYFTGNFCSAKLLWALSFVLNRGCFLHKNYNLPLDIIPTGLLKGFLDIVSPSVISTVNSSMATGAIPSRFVHSTRLCVL